MFALFILYVIVEVAALVVVGNAIGVLWTVLLLLTGSAFGLVLFRSQGKRTIAGLRAASRGERAPGGAISDGVLFAIGSVAMFIPGLVTTAFGLLLLMPPTRWALRPLVLLVAGRWMPVVTAATAATAATARRRSTVIDGEVVTEPTDKPGAGQIIELEGQDFEKRSR